MAKPGAVIVAGLAGVQASPCAYAVNRFIRLPTWDRFILPLPWSRGVFAVGDGFTPPSRLSQEEAEEAAARLGTLIVDLTEACEARLKRPPGG
jgi:lysophospholipid acyltransferase (LPLAT)-like uncharacterized protein